MFTLGKNCAIILREIYKQRYIASQKLIQSAQTRMEWDPGWLVGLDLFVLATTRATAVAADAQLTGWRVQSKYSLCLKIRLFFLQVLQGGGQQPGQPAPAAAVRWKQQQRQGGGEQDQQQQQQRQRRQQQQQPCHGRQLEQAEPHQGQGQSLGEVPTR